MPMEPSRLGEWQFGGQSEVCQRAFDTIHPDIMSGWNANLILGLSCMNQPSGSYPDGGARNSLCRSLVPALPI